MSHTIHSSPRRSLPVPSSASGMLVSDADGNTCIDASGTGAVSSLGHGHPDVLAAMHRQIDSNACAHPPLFTSDVTGELAARLVANAPAGLSAVYFVSGGSEAMETALKLARQYFVESGEVRRSVFIARRQSFHGHTLGALAISGNEWGRRPFAPLLMPVPRVAPCYEYRGREPGQTQAGYTASLLRELEDKIIETGPGNVIGFCAEPVAGGAIPPTPGYFRGVRALCDKYGILFIADEAVCGMGRTGTMFSIEQDGVAPDIVTIAAGLAAGYQPIGAVLAQGWLAERVRPASGIFHHGGACGAHPLAAAAALAVQKVIERDGLLATVRMRGASLRSMLAEAFGRHEHVGDIRGRGLLLVIELVQDRATKEPFAPSLQLHAAIQAQAMANGLMVYPTGGTIDGQKGDHVLLAPPFTAADDVLAEVVSRLADAVDGALKRVKARAGSAELSPSG